MNPIQIFALGCFLAGVYFGTGITMMVVMVACNKEKAP